jgi:hypothetical protein
MHTHLSLQLSKKEEWYANKLHSNARSFSHLDWDFFIFIKIG